VAVPVFINCRDRFGCLRDLVTWLERADCDEIYLIDNDSSYEPLLEFYRESPHTVLRLGANYGKNALWDAPGVFERTRGRHFVYSDPDIVPVEECPLDALERFRDLLDRWSVYKVGFGLKWDDIPDHYPYKREVLILERGNWEWPFEHGAYLAPIDTTFGLYRPNGQPRPNEAIRTGYPYIARHTAWYLDFENLQEDERHYQEHAATNTTWSAETSHWTATTLTEAHQDQVASLQAARARRFERWSTQLKWRLYGRRRFRTPEAPTG
jgi:hypothetical protein